METIALIWQVNINNIFIQFAGISLYHIKK